MKAGEYIRLNRNAVAEIRALDAYLMRTCNKRYDWNQINVYDIPVINGIHRRRHVSVTFNLPSLKVKYWVDGQLMEEDSYHGYDDFEMANAIEDWNGRCFLCELEYFI